jgi:putative transposase
MRYVYDGITPYRDNGLYQDIDLGVSNIVSAANLHFKFIQVKNRRADIFWKKKMEQVQSKRDHCKRYSHHWERYNTKLVRMKQKCANQMWDYQHKISKKIVDNTQSQHHYYWRHKREIDGKKTKGNGKPTKNQGS